MEQASVVQVRNFKFSPRSNWLSSSTVLLCHFTYLDQCQVPNPIYSMASAYLMVSTDVVGKCMMRATG